MFRKFAVWKNEAGKGQGESLIGKGYSIELLKVQAPDQYRSNGSATTQPL